MWCDEHSNCFWDISIQIFDFLKHVSSLSVVTSYSRDSITARDSSDLRSYSSCSVHTILKNIIKSKTSPHRDWFKNIVYWRERHYFLSNTRSLAFCCMYMAYLSIELMMLLRDGYGYDENQYHSNTQHKHTPSTARNTFFYSFGKEKMYILH